jgi:hypothetical protein
VGKILLKNPQLKDRGTVKHSDSGKEGSRGGGNSFDMMKCSHRIEVGGMERTKAG